MNNKKGKTTGNWQLKGRGRMFLRQAVAGVLAVSLSAALPAGTAFAASVTSDQADTSYNSTADGENAVLVDGSSVTLDHVTVNKTGDSNSENADFSGTNAAVLATNGATLTISNAAVTTNGAHANGVFSYGTGTTVNISDSTIETSSNNSGGLMTTGGATMNASNLTITTQGNSSAAIRSDRGGGTVTVDEGTYTTNGKGSPAIYSTADITVSNATLTANDSEAVVIEGGNSVTLNEDVVTGNDADLNGQSTTKTNVLIYQSMSGDASEGSSAFTMKGGSLTAQTGAMFWVTNTTTTIHLEDVDLTYAEGDNDLMILAAGPWGSSGSNGGNATVEAVQQALEGNITVDSSSTLNLILSDGSSYTGAINSDGQEGEVYVEVPEGTTWTLTADSYITSLTAAASSIDLNGYTLYVNGEAYTAGTAASGSAVSAKSGSSQSGQGNQPQQGQPGNGQDSQSQPPQKPSDENQNGQNNSSQTADDSNNNSNPSGQSQSGSNQSVDSDSQSQMGDDPSQRSNTQPQPPSGQPGQKPGTAGQGQQPPEKPASPFTDIDSSAYYAQAADWAWMRGITSGTGTATDTSSQTDSTPSANLLFSPGQETTRAQMVTFLWRLAGSPEPETTTISFTDVEEDAYYYKAVLWAVEQGITAGTSATTFSPDRSCSRAEMITFLAGYAQSQGADMTSSTNASETFSDVPADSYYAEAVSWALSNHITAGTTQTTFDPGKTCTRAQAVTFLYQLDQLLGQGGQPDVSE